MKKIFLVFAIIVMQHSADAQDKELPAGNSFSAGIESSLPIALFGNVYSFGIGASVQENFIVSNNIALTVYAGYLNYLLKSTYGGGNQGYIPVLGGTEIQISHRVFVSAQLGITFRTMELPSEFTYSPGVGLHISKHFTALLKYIGETSAAINSSSIGLRVAYVFRK